MLVNNNDFTIYNADNENSIIDRISSMMGTTPFWLHINIDDDDETQLTNAEKITAVNILNDLKQEVPNTISFKAIESKYYEWILSKTSDAQDAGKELARMFVVFYTDDYDPDNFMTKLSLEDIFKDSGGTEFDLDFIENVIMNKSVILQKIRREIKDVKKQSDKKEEELKKTNNEIENVNVNVTDFKIESIVTTISITTDKPIVLSHVMDSLDLNDSILFAKYNNFFKVNEKHRSVFKNYEYDSDQSQGLLVVFFTVNRRKYSFRELLFKEVDANKFIVDVDTVDEVDLIEIKTILLNTGFVVNNRENTRIKGVFDILDQNFHKELFLDEIMNNEQFFNMYVNERFKVNKNANRINVYFYTIKTGNVSFNMGNESNNTKIRVTKISSRENIEFFVKFFSSLFQTYKSREKMLLSFYSKYIQNIGLTVQTESSVLNNEDAQKKAVRYRNPLAEKEPTLFVQLYTRKCAKPPRILEPDEEVPDGYDTMTFPKYQEGGLQERIYVCDNTGSFKYPGLRKNTLANSNIFKYIPCCYETNQENRKGSPLNAYLTGAVKDKNEKYEHMLYKTSRILPNENKGVLPPGIVRLLGKNSIRKGVFVGPNSFIDCVSRVTKIEADDIHDENNRRQTLENIRLSLSYEVCAQENSDIDLSSVSKWFSDNSTYFEPRRFFRAVEDYFNANIYLFERSCDYVKGISEDNRLEFVKTNTNNGVLSVPNKPSHGVYIDPKRYKTNVFVYVHMGGAVDSVSYPHCEYIVLNSNDDAHIEKQVERVYRNILIQSRKDHLSQTVNVKDVDYQILDSTGRIVKLKMKSGKLVKYTRPMLPLPVPIHKNNIKPQEDVLRNHVYMKRLARVFLEYCLIKYANSGEEDLDDFFENYTTIDENFEYKKIAPKFNIEYYDQVFTDENDKIVFESEDTEQRIRYSMELIIRRDGLSKFVNQNVIRSYFDNPLDFQDVVLTNTAFKEFAFDPVQGQALNNFIEELNNTKLVILKNSEYVELNGYFGVFNSVEDIKQHIIPDNDLSSVDTYFLWDEENGFKRYYVKNGSGLTIVVFKYALTYYLGKYSDI